MNNIRDIEISDIPRVAEIGVFAWRCAYRGIVSEDFLFNEMIVHKRIEHLTNHFNDSKSKYYVYDDGIIKGFLRMGPCEDDDELGSFEVWALYVDPFMQRQGIGMAMISFCEETARKLGYNRICLWTLEKNAAARAFYEKMGYMLDGVRKYLKDIEVHQVRYIKQIEGCD